MLLIHCCHSQADKALKDKWFSLSILLYVWPVLSDTIIGLESQFFTFFEWPLKTSFTLHPLCLCHVSRFSPWFHSIYVVVLLGCVVL